MGAVESLGCLVCRRAPELHRPDATPHDPYQSIPLCACHHRGRGGLHQDPTAFAELWGDEAALLAWIAAAGVLVTPGRAAGLLEGVGLG